MTSVLLWHDLFVYAKRACKHFGLPVVKRLEPIVKNGHSIRDRADGYADKPARSIQLRVWRLGKPGAVMKASTITAALVHELAHFGGGREGLGHGAEHGELTRQIAEWFKEQGFAVAHTLHSTNDPAKPRKVAFRRAWKRPKPRRKKVSR